ncbi:hypothetical protein D3C73_552010 [compost metagenome]
MPDQAFHLAFGNDIFHIFFIPKRTGNQDLPFFDPGIAAYHRPALLGVDFSHNRIGSADQMALAEQRSVLRLVRFNHLNRNARPRPRHPYPGNT